MTRRVRGDGASWHARAPARIDFAGGWTDVPDYAAREGGVVVSAAISRYAHVDAVRGGAGVRLHAEDLKVRVRYDSPADIRYDGTLDLHKAALNMLPVTGGLELLSRCDLPPGSGLGASGALDVALCAALATARGERYDPLELAELGFQLEAEELKLAGGRQDQYTAALGGFNQLTFGEGPVAVRPLRVTREAALDLERHAVLAYTGESHFSSATHRRVWSAWEAGEARVRDALRAIRDLATGVPERLEAGDWEGVAALVDENWIQQRALDATISTPRTQEIERAARAAGAWGVKATGAGAGGCLLALAPAARRAAVAAAVTGAGAQVLEFAFEFDGVRSWETVDADRNAG